MIEKNEILTLASRLSLNPDTIEKDYVLSWLLWGINNDKSLADSWIFKGGTCLKKCFFETFRFSEDLDFTVSKLEHLTVEFLHEKFLQITDQIYEETGITFFKNQFKFKAIPKGNGQISAQGKIQYNGPLRRKQGGASIKLDLTTDEIIVLTPQRRNVHHPYSDEPATGIWSNCYAFEEIIGEKIRALAERARPRDLYDVIHFFRNRKMIENFQLVYNVLLKKCGYKKIGVPTYISIKEHEKIEELKSQWKNMLAHQLPSLPPLQSFWQDLEPFFEWLEGNLREERLVEPKEFDGAIFHPGRVTNAYSIDTNIQKIQFAAANRICVEIVYNAKTRTVEPLSFRQSNVGNKLFYGFERESNQIKAFSLSKIQNVIITNKPYTEKYPVEISASGQVVMPYIRKTSRKNLLGYRNKANFQYIFACPSCEKLFKRKNFNSRLRSHKNKNGLQCYGRIGILVK